jgi:hypothetical protein
MTATKSTIVVTQFHKDAYAIAQTACKAGITMAQKLSALLTARYGDTSPTFEEYRADQAALAHMAKLKGLVDNQWVRKPYALAVKSRYGKLPESQDPAAILKAAKRAADKAEKDAKEGKASAGAPAGKTQDHGTSDAETIEAIVTRLNVFKCLEACINILAADKTTKAQAIHMRAQAQKAAQLCAAPVVPMIPVDGTSPASTRKAKAQPVAKALSDLPALLAA